MRGKRGARFRAGEAALRQIEFLEQEIAAVERLIAQHTLGSRDARRLLTVPGVNLICAATFLAAIGEIRRFRGSRQLVAYLGLDPRVRQSGAAPARTGHISKQGSPQPRCSKRPQSSCASLGLRTPSTSTSKRAAATPSRQSPQRASSRVCSGACRPAARSTPTRSHR
jgi:transposase